jgi:hypothetical protein
MAMSKAEQREMEALRTRLALAWPPVPPKPVDLDVARAAADVDWLHLWWFSVNQRMVGIGVTNGHASSTRDYTDEQIKNRYTGGSYVTMSQGPGGPWFSTEADAYRALHYAVAQRCAEDLRNIELRIEALNSPTPRSTT